MYSLFKRYHEKQENDFRINPFRLSFLDTGQEQLFKTAYFENNLQLGRACHLIAIFFYCLVGMWDGLYFEPGHFWAWCWVLPIVSLIFCAGLVSSYYARTFYARYWQPLFAFYVLMTGTGFTAVTLVSAPDYPAYHFIGIIFCLFFCYAFIRLTFLWAAGAGSFIVILYTSAVVFSFQVPERLVLNEFFYMFGINLLGIMVCYSMELLSRRDFILTSLLKQAEAKAKDMNILLEQRVSDRTAALTHTNQELNESLNSRKKLEAQLFQAQKMEAVGRLAGGVAHDYNNISSIIIGYSELAMEELKKDHPLYDNLENIISAATRATDLTRQLLAFARKQPIAPKVIDLNHTIADMLKILGRLIGENIRLEWKPGRDIWPIKIDPAQIDQILANLCVNARDAISDTGTITIETKTIRLDRTYCKNHPGFKPGAYSMLMVSDDGQGMAPETRDKIFDPFFTTKAVGQGTGLGLATVYGIVKQNNGFINVYSEPGQGTTFKVYLARHTEADEKTVTAPTEKMPAGRGETILLVEDQPAILKLTQKMLEQLGYRVLGAGSPEAAVDIAARGHRIDLLLSDVIMPDMNGRRLAKTLMTSRPGLKVLFMSGYTANIIATRGVLDSGINFISKPFSKAALAMKVRMVLDDNNC